MQGRTRRGVMGGAVDLGEMGHSDAIVMHVQVALNHARMAQKDMMIPHLDEGVLELKEAVAHGNQGHAGVATKYAKSAVMHLFEVP
ncbi:MAG: small metal-binding protein SmbP [Nitrospirales bacterium]